MNKTNDQGISTMQPMQKYNYRMYSPMGCTNSYMLWNQMMTEYNRKDAADDEGYRPGPGGKPKPGGGHGPGGNPKPGGGHGPGGNPKPGGGHGHGGNPKPGGGHGYGGGHGGYHYDIEYDYDFNYFYYLNSSYYPYYPYNPYYDYYNDTY